MRWTVNNLCHCACPFTQVSKCRQKHLIAELTSICQLDAVLSCITGNSHMVIGYGEKPQFKDLPF